MAFPNDAPPLFLYLVAVQLLVEGSRLSDWRAGSAYRTPKNKTSAPNLRLGRTLVPSLAITVVYSTFAAADSTFVAVYLPSLWVDSPLFITDKANRRGVLDQQGQRT